MNSLIQKDALSSLQFSFPVEYAIRKIQETDLGTHLVLAYADDASLKGDDVRTLEVNVNVLLNACEDIVLAVNIGKLST